MSDHEQTIAEIEAGMERDLAESAARRAAFVADFSKPLPNWPLRFYLAGCAVLLVAFVAALIWAGR